MPYGSGQRLGDTVRPELGRYDYSGQANAGQLLGQGFAAAGEAVGKYQDNEKEIKKSIKVAESIKELLPDFAPVAQKFIDEMNSPDASQRQRLGGAEGLKEAMNMAFMADDRTTRKAQFAAEMALKEQDRQDRIDAARNAPIPAPHVEKFNTAGGEQQMIWNGRTGQFDLPQPPSVGSPQSGLGGKLPDPLKPFAANFEESGNKYGVAPQLLAAIAMHETGNGTSSAFRNKKNLMGVSDENGPIQMENEAASIERMARLIGQGIHQNTGPYAGVNSIEGLAKVYAPQGAGNDPRNLNQHWVGGVSSNLEKLNAEAQGIADASQQRFGFKPTDKDGAFRPATTEEIARYGVNGQVDSKGRFYPINPPQGMTLESDGQGGFRMAQGAGVGTKQADQQKAKEKTDRQGLDSTIGSSLEVLNKMDGVLANNPVAAKGQGVLSSFLPATEAGQIAKDLKSIQNQNSKKSIFEMKEMTGAVGQTTEAEWPRYESRFGEMEVGMAPAQIKRVLQLNALNRFEAVMGSPDKMLKMLDDKQITQEQFDNYAAEYLMARNELKIPDDGVMGRKMDWSRLDPRMVGLKSQQQGQPNTPAGYQFSPSTQSLLERSRASQAR